MGGLRSDSGVLVLALAGAGLAEQNALEAADVIHAVNGKPVDTVEALRTSLEAIPDGAPLVLQIERGGMLSYIVPGAMPGAEQRLKKTASRMPPAASHRPSTRFRIEDRQASCRQRGQSLRRPFRHRHAAMHSGWRRAESARRASSLPARAFRPMRYSRIPRRPACRPTGMA